MPARTLLISMPFGSATRPSIALGLLQAALHRHQLECECAYLNVQFAAMLGTDEYTLIAEQLPPDSLVGEWVFAKLLFPSCLSGHSGYEHGILDRYFSASFGEQARAVARRASVLAGEFLRQALSRLDLKRFEVVGFTSSFHQNVASLCLARMVKEAHPAAKIIFGGANCEGEMGLTILRWFPFVDYVCLGEGDDTFVALVDALARRETPPVVGNIVGRAGADDTRGRPASPRPDLDDLPIPEYDDYFAEMRAQSLTLAPSIPIEFSRGCWWGAKHHCTFCGLNGSSMAYASKSPSRAIAELDILASRYGGSFLCVDNIFDLRYLRTVFPVLAEGSRRYEVFVETKANLRKEQIRLLRAAGVLRLQPGIESLSTHVLKLMRKGTTMLQNVQTLKWCKELGVGVSWNLLTGFPGEQREDYRQILNLLPLLSHLDAPMGWGAVRIDRFSPFHSAPEAFGFCDLRAHDAYRAIYPLSSDALNGLAYYFQGSYDQAPASTEFIKDLGSIVDAWRVADGVSHLTCEPIDGTVNVSDNRMGKDTIHRVTGLAAQVLLGCDQMQSLDALAERLPDRFRQATSAQIGEALAHLQTLGLVIEEDNKYLALTVSAGKARDRAVTRT